MGSSLSGYLELLVRRLAGLGGRVPGGRPLVEAAAERMGSRPRLKGALLLYAASAGEAGRLLSLPLPSGVADEYRAALSALRGMRPEDAVRDPEAMAALGREYSRHLATYAAGEGAPARESARRGRLIRQIEVLSGVAAAAAAVGLPGDAPSRRALLESMPTKRLSGIRRAMVEAARDSGI